jgi:hypothetical protein
MIGRELIKQDFNAISKDLILEAAFAPGYYIYSFEFEGKTKFLKVLVE